MPIDIEGSFQYKYPLAQPKIGSLERRFLLQAYDSGWISSSGQFINRFEKEFSNYIGMKYGIATTNGTAALHLALVSIGLTSRDEVLVPDLTFVSPANMVILAGARPVFVDSNEYYWGVDVSKIKNRVTKRTKAIIIVHLYGHPVDLDPILEFCDAKGLILIEDCAEAHGALYKQKKVGSFGHISCFSFYGNKLLTTGEGGMCLTNDSQIAERLRKLRDHGADRRKHFWHPIMGFNYRMTNLQAAIGCAQLLTLEKRISKYRKIATIYSSFLKDKIKDQNIVIHPEMKWAKCVYWMYTFLMEQSKVTKRESIRTFLAKHGIETRPMFYPVSRLPPFRKFGQANPIALSLSGRGISLPTYYELNDKDIGFITDRVKEALTNT